jgi:chromosome segregation ATPase
MNPYTDEKMGAEIGSTGWGLDLLARRVKKLEARIDKLEEAGESAPPLQFQIEALTYRMRAMEDGYLALKERVEENDAKQEARFNRLLGLIDREADLGLEMAKRIEHLEEADALWDEWADKHLTVKGGMEHEFDEGEQNADQGSHDECEGDVPQSGATAEGRAQG